MRTIERMRRHSDEFSRRVSRQLRVGMTIIVVASSEIPEAVFIAGKTRGARNIVNSQFKMLTAKSPAGISESAANATSNGKFAPKCAAATVKKAVNKIVKNVNEPR